MRAIDEVVHGKRSILDRMPGDAWLKFANLRLHYMFMGAHPGRKHPFMVGEFGHGGEWNYSASRDWHLLEFQPHAGLQCFVQDLSALHAVSPALCEVDFDAAGFEWIDCSDTDQKSLLSTIRDRPEIWEVRANHIRREDEAAEGYGLVSFSTGVLREISW